MQLPHDQGGSLRSVLKSTASFRIGARKKFYVVLHLTLFEKSSRGDPGRPLRSTDRDMIPGSRLEIPALSLATSSKMLCPTFLCLLDFLGCPSIVVNREHTKMSTPRVGTRLLRESRSDGFRYRRSMIKEWMGPDVRVLMHPLRNYTLGFIQCVKDFCIQPFLSMCR